MYLFTTVQEGKTSALPSAFLKLGTIMKPSGPFRRELNWLLCNMELLYSTIVSELNTHCAACGSVTDTSLVHLHKPSSLRTLKD